MVVVGVGVVEVAITVDVVVVTLKTGTSVRQAVQQQYGTKEYIRNL